jgi:5-methylcytosine-specific restriction protein B
MDQATSKVFLIAGGQPLAGITPAPIGYAQTFLELSNRARQLNGSALSIVNEPTKQPITAQAGIGECRKTLGELFALMRQRHQEFAFRTMAEILRFLAVDYELTDAKDKWDWQAAMDAQILQKILPKLHGSKRKIGSLLAALATYCEKEDNYSAAEEVLKNEPKAETYPASEGKRASSPRFAESHRKLCEMIEAVRRDQFVSYIQ